MAVDDDYELPRQPSPPKRKPPARGIAGASAAKKPALSSMSKPSAPSAGASAGPKKAAKLPASAPEEPVRYKFSPEDADERISEYVPEEILSQISDSQWKIRLAGKKANPLYPTFASDRC
jgi:cytoskeleton-associated protein 5